MLNLSILRPIAILSLTIVAGILVYLDFFYDRNGKAIPWTPYVPTIKDDSTVNLTGNGVAILPNATVGTQNLSYQISFKIITRSTNCNVFKTGLSSNGISIDVTNDAKLTFRHFDNDAKFVVQLVSNKTISDGKLHHCVIVRNHYQWYMVVDGERNADKVSKYDTAISSVSNAFVGYYDESGQISSRLVGCLRELTFDNVVQKSYVTTGSVSVGKCAIVL